MSLLPSESHVFFPFPVTRRQLKIITNRNFDRRSGSVELEKRADQHWEKRVKDNPCLFNGSKFRFAGMVVLSGKVIPERGSWFVIPDRTKKLELEMRTGFSCYKDYTTTNMGKDAPHFAKYGLDRYGDPQHCMGDIIGHSGLIVTSEGYVVIQLRSQTVGEGCGMWHFPGGHPEPEEIGVKGSEGLMAVSSTRIVDEVYASFLRELKEELNLSEEYLSDPVLVGIGKDPASHFKPEFNMIVHCSLTAQQVSQLYYADDFNDSESVDIGFWDISKLHLKNKQTTFTLTKFKSDDPGTVTVSCDRLAGSSFQFLSNLERVLEINPTLLTK